MSATWASPASVRFIQAWVRVYTVGLPPSVKDARREEIAADLWDQVHESLAEGRRPASTHLMLRWLGGIPDDLTWRLAHLRHRDRALDERQSDRLWAKWIAIGGAMLTVLLLIGAVFGTIENLRQHDFVYVPSWGAVVPFAVPLGLAMIAVGFARIRLSPEPGALLVSFGAAAVAIMFWWYVAPDVVAIALSIYAFRLARRIEKARGYRADFNA